MPDESNTEGATPPVMKAWRFAEFGDIINFQLADYPDPEVSDGDILLRTKFAALNPADRLLVEGSYPGAGERPLTVGRDGSGIVEKAPAGCALQPGDGALILRSPVGITLQGTLAEYVAVPQEYVAPLPEGWTFEEGAAGSVVYLTAWKALVIQGGLKAGDTVLVTGASGGVGIASIQLAKALGARVVALSRDNAKHEQLKALGADLCLDSSLAPAELESTIRESLDGGGVDIVIENIAGPTLQSSVNLCNLNGRIMVIGLLGGRKSEVTLGMLLFNQVRIEGVHVGKFSPEGARTAWTDLVTTLGKGRPLIDKTFPFEQVQEAFAHLAGSHLGKVLVQVAE